MTLKRSRSRSYVLLFKNACEEAGIKIIPVGIGTSEWIDKLGKRNFEMYLGAWQESILESDYSQLWHTKFIGDGSNYCGFGDAKSDAILDALTNEISEEKRAILYKELQQIIDEEVPYIFLVSVKHRIAINKRIINPNFSMLGNGYWEQGFQVEGAQ